MIPVVEYDTTAIVIDKVSAVGDVVKNKGTYSFEVYLDGRVDPLLVGAFDKETALENRNELVAIVAQYYFTTHFGPDFDLESMIDGMDADLIDDDHDGENDDGDAH